jgi:hypothetical protein
MQCATHPDVETELGCSRCGKAICARCLVHTPVGARCRECANVRRLPAYNLGADTYVRGVVASLVIGTAAGLGWWFFYSLTFALGWISLIAVGLGLGYVVGEGVAFATNRRAGPPLQIIAVCGVILAYLVRMTLLITVDDQGLADLRGPIETFGLLALVVACWFAAQRLR